LEAEANKSTKYASLAVRHDFVPIAIETLGSWGAAAYPSLMKLEEKLPQFPGICVQRRS
jgi:hypothetical protein